MGDSAGGSLVSRLVSLSENSVLSPLVGEPVTEVARRLLTGLGVLKPKPEVLELGTARDLFDQLFTRLIDRLDEDRQARLRGAWQNLRDAVNLPDPSPLVTHALVTFNEIASLPADGYTSGVSNQHLRATATLGRAAARWMLAGRLSDLYDDVVQSAVISRPTVTYLFGPGISARLSSLPPPLPRRSGGAPQVVFSDDGELVALVASNKWEKSSVIRLRDGQEVASAYHDIDVLFVEEAQFSPSGRLFVCTEDRPNEAIGHSLLMVSPRSGAVRRHVARHSYRDALRQRNFDPIQVAVLTDSRLVASTASSNDDLWLFDLERMVPLRREELGPTVVGGPTVAGRGVEATFGLAARGGIAVAAIGNPPNITLAVCSTVDLSLLARLTLPENVFPGTLAITPDEETVVMGNREPGRILVHRWRWRREQRLRPGASITVRSHHPRHSALAADGGVVAVAADSGLVHLHDATNGAVLTELQFPEIVTNNPPLDGAFEKYHSAVYVARDGLQVAVTSNAGWVEVRPVSPTLPGRSVPQVQS